MTSSDSEIHTQPETRSVTGDTTEFDLQTFFPYLIRVFHTDITKTLTSIYQPKYGMLPADWRTMAIIGGAERPLQSTEIVERSSMDKVVVSRAVKKMEKLGYFTRASNKSDGRSSLISLSVEGEKVYADLSSQLLQLEQHMLSGISREQLDEFKKTVATIRKNLGTVQPEE